MIKGRAEIWAIFDSDNSMGACYLIISSIIMLSRETRTDFKLFVSIGPHILNFVILLLLL